MCQALNSKFINTSKFQLVNFANDFLYIKLNHQIELLRGLSSYFSINLIDDLLWFFPCRCDIRTQCEQSLHFQLYWSLISEIKNVESKVNNSTINIKKFWNELGVLKSPSKLFEKEENKFPVSSSAKKIFKIMFLNFRIYPHFKSHFI